MPLYGFKKEPNTTVVGAALNKDELAAFFEAATEHYSDKYKSDLMMHLTDPLFQGFETEVAIFEHADPAQQQSFIDKYEILIGTPQRAVDRHKDMVDYDAPDPWLEDDTRTIAEIHNLTEGNDKWDKRSDEEKAADEQMKKMIDEMKKKGELSNDDSFSSKQNKKEGDDVYVNDIRTSINADGTINIDNVLATKVEEQQTNAVLDMQFGGKNVRVDVNWVKRDLQGSEDLRNDLYFSDKYRDQWAAGEEPVLTVTTRDGKFKSNVKFQEMVGELIADQALTKDNGPAAPQSAVDTVLGQLSAATGQNIQGINIVDPNTGATQESFTSSKFGTDYLFAFYRGEGAEEGVCFYVTSKAYWAAEGAIDDTHQSTMAGGPLPFPDNYEEVTEATFVVHDQDEAQVRAQMLAWGFEHSPTMEAFLDN